MIFTVKLACGDEWRFSRGSAPGMGEQLICRVCHANTHRLYDRVYKGEICEEYRWHCTTEQCRAGRRVGMSVSEARYQATLHTKKHPNHDIHIVDPTGRVIDRFGKDQLAYLPDQPEHHDQIPF